VKNLSEPPRHPNEEQTGEENDVKPMDQDVDQEEDADRRLMRVNAGLVEPIPVCGAD
jgi:hypothetical protein